VFSLFRRFIGVSANLKTLRPLLRSGSAVGWFRVVFLLWVYWASFCDDFVYLCIALPGRVSLLWFPAISGYHRWRGLQVYFFWRQSLYRKTVPRLYHALVLALKYWCVIEVFNKFHLTRDTLLRATAPVPGGQMFSSWRLSRRGTVRAG